MQCILYKIYFFESFSYELQFDMHFYMHSYLHKSFYSCKKWVLQHPRLQAIKLLASLTYPLKITKGQPNSHPPHQHPTRCRAQWGLRVRVVPEVEALGATTQGW
jgi:hypothetical protein